ncbi:unnamed protein product, partial [Laminaria digitata]
MPHPGYPCPWQHHGAPSTSAAPSSLSLSYSHPPNPTTTTSSLSPSNPTMSPTRQTNNPASTLLKKGTASPTASDKPVPASPTAPTGMLFLFALFDCETEAYVTHDPMFEGVSGVQLYLNFITDDMVEKMKKQM